MKQRVLATTLVFLRLANVGEVSLLKTSPPGNLLFLLLPSKTTCDPFCALPALADRVDVIDSKAA